MRVVDASGNLKVSTVVSSLAFGGTTLPLDTTAPADGSLLGRSGSNIVGVAAATQAEQETATSTTKWVSPGRQQYHTSAAKAWVKFNGVGTPGVVASYNITSITDHGVGEFTVVWDVDFSSANYAVIAGSSWKNGTDALIQPPIFDDDAVVAGSARMACLGTSHAVQDPRNVYVAAFGDQ